MRFAIALLAAAACGSSPREPVSAKSVAAIDAIAERALREGNVVGLSIVVMRGEQVVHARGYGWADSEQRVPATEHSVYLLASLSKQFWAVGIAQLVEQNRLSVESAIADVLYHFPDRRVKVKHLLTQTSGLGDDDDNEDDVKFTDNPKVAFEPGTSWRYSNRGAILVRRLVEQITSAPWRNYLDEHIAKPLGLRSVTTCDRQPPMYDRDKRRMTESAKKVAVIQFVCADALDVARFERSFDTGALLRRETVAKMRAQTNVGDVQLPYGWLTRIGELNGHRAYGHTGSGRGVSIAAFRFPEDDLTIVVLMNSAARRGNRAYDLLVRIARAELHLPAPELRDRALSETELADIVGTYGEGPARAEITAREGHAYLTFSIDGAKKWEGALVTNDGRSFAGGPDGVDPDDLATFLPARGKAVAIAVGHRFLLENLFVRTGN